MFFKEVVKKTRRLAKKVEDALMTIANHFCHNLSDGHNKNRCEKAAQTSDNFNTELSSGMKKDVSSYM